MENNTLSLLQTEIERFSPSEILSRAIDRFGHGKIAQRLSLNNTIHLMTRLAAEIAADSGSTHNRRM